MPELSDIYIESLSSKIEGEYHFDRKCDVIKVPAILDGSNIILWVFVRKCFCLRKRNAIDDISYKGVRLPKDGFEIHKTENCDVYKVTENATYDGLRFQFQKVCYCTSQNRSYER